ncbi:MAG TPA: glycogen phosphorylase, partial [Tianweitania sediminis]|nr:glycogen phosphorylase [Tianweitania sediminis]
MTEMMTPRKHPVAPLPEAGTLADEIVKALMFRVGKNPSVATGYDWLNASIKVVRDRIIARWIESTQRTYEAGGKRVYYLSLEFLIGRLMRDAFSNIGLMEEMRDALASLGVDIDVIAELEPDAALGNGG